MSTDHRVLFSESELKALSESPEALQVLIDQHGYWETCAEGMDMPECAQHHRDRAIGLRLALGVALIKREETGPIQTEVCPCGAFELDGQVLHSASCEHAEPRCPRPCNGRPDQWTMAQCILAGECGCTKAACEARAAGETSASPSFRPCGCDGEACKGHPEQPAPDVKGDA